MSLKDKQPIADMVSSPTCSYDSITHSANISPSPPTLTHHSRDYKLDGGRERHDFRPDRVKEYARKDDDCQHLENGE